MPGPWRQWIPTARTIVVAFVHLGLVSLAYAIAVLLRFEFQVPAEEVPTLARAFVPLLALRAAFFARHHVFSSWWQYVGVRDVTGILRGTTEGSLAFVLFILFAGMTPGFPRSVIVLEWLLTLQLVTGARVLARSLRAVVGRMGVRRHRDVLIVGSGVIGESILRELRFHPSEKRPIGYLDDPAFDPPGRMMRQLPRLGDRRDLARLIRETGVQEVLLALPGQFQHEIRQAIRECRSCNVPFRIFSSVQDYLDQPRTVSTPHLDELLDPSERNPEPDATREAFYQKTVLVLGAGGQIGSALARLIAESQPRQLLLFDRNESPLYYLEVDLLQQGAIVPVVPLVGDVLDRDRLTQVFERYRPDVVIHGAAYTGREGLEDNRNEIRDNNLGALENTVQLCRRWGVGRAIFLSFDPRRHDFLQCLHRAGEAYLRETRGRGTCAALRFPTVLGHPACEATRIARTMLARRPVYLHERTEELRVASLPNVAAALIDAIPLARDGDVLSVDVGQTIAATDLIATLGQVWNLPEVPIELTPTLPDHVHRLEPAEPTRRPAIVRHSPPPLESECVSTLRGERPFAPHLRVLPHRSRG